MKTRKINVNKGIRVILPALAICVASKLPAVPKWPVTIYGLCRIDLKPIPIRTTRFRRT